MSKVDKRMFKKTGAELENYLNIMSKHQVIQNKKGKGSFKRNKKVDLSEY